MIRANDPALESWVPVAKGSDFPIQNLPFGIFKTKTIRTGVAIGEHIVDLSLLHTLGFIKLEALTPDIFNKASLNEFFSLGKPVIRAVRNRVSELLAAQNNELKSQTDILKSILIPQKDAKLMMPVQVQNYTDFYSSEEHARNVGSMFRDPKNALLPNWKHLPVAYHGRASSIVVSGTEVRRPKGQIKLSNEESPVFSPSRKLDFELEMAFVTCRDTELGTSISTDEAIDRLLPDSFFLTIGLHGIFNSGNMFHSDLSEEKILRPLSHPGL